MLIGIDGNEANVKNRVGVNKYAFEIISGIYELLPKNLDLIVTVYLKNKPLDDMPKENFQFKYKILSGGKIWILTKLTPHLLFTKQKPDVFFTPNHYIPPFTLMPTVCAIMDLGYLDSSAQFKKYDFWQLSLWTAWSIKRSKCILTISNATREDIVRRYPNSKNKLVVTYPGVDKYLATDYSISKINKLKNKYSIVNDYILYLGTLKPSKNIEGLIKAYNILVLQYPNIQLVIAGKYGWLYKSIFKLVYELGLEEKVIFTDFIKEEDKPALIKGAKVFVLPSFWEGFGLDILSAFALEIPVVASNVGSLPEVVGNTDLLIDPHNPESITKAIQKILNINKKDYKDYNELITKQNLQLRKFSWDKAAKITFKILKKATND